MGELTGREWVEELTTAILNYYGYTDEQIAEVATIHPGRICFQDECYDEDGESVHPEVYREAWATSSIVVEVIEPFVERILAARRESLAERVRALADEWTHATCQTDGAPCSWHRVSAECADELLALLDPSETP